MPDIYDSMAFHVLDTISANGSHWDYVDEKWREEYEILVEEGYLEIDPTGALFRVTELGEWHCENIQCSWSRSDRTWNRHRPIRLTMRGYARRRRCKVAAVIEACEGRLAFAVQDGKIDREIADALWVTVAREKTITPIS